MEQEQAEREEEHAETMRKAQDMIARMKEETRRKIKQMEQVM